MAPIWVWMIYQLESRAVFGAIRRCDRAHWSAAQARAELEHVAQEMGIIGRIDWDPVDERTEVGRSELGYLAVVTSVLPPEGEAPTSGSQSLQS